MLFLSCFREGCVFGLHSNNMTSKIKWQERSEFCLILILNTINESWVQEKTSHYIKLSQAKQKKPKKTNKQGKNTTSKQITKLKTDVGSCPAKIFTSDSFTESFDLRPLGTVYWGGAPSQVTVRTMDLGSQYGNRTILYLVKFPVLFLCWFRTFFL